MCHFAVSTIQAGFLLWGSCWYSARANASSSNSAEPNLKTFGRKIGQTRTVASPGVVLRSVPYKQVSSRLVLSESKGFEFDLGETKIAPLEEKKRGQTGITVEFGKELCFSSSIESFKAADQPIWRCGGPGRARPQSPIQISKKIF